MPTHLYRVLRQLFPQSVGLEEDKEEILSEADTIWGGAQKGRAWDLAPRALAACRPAATAGEGTAIKAHGGLRSPEGTEESFIIDKAAQLKGRGDEAPSTARAAARLFIGPAWPYALALEASKQGRWDGVVQGDAGQGVLGDLLMGWTPAQIFC